MRLKNVDRRRAPIDSAAVAELDTPIKRAKKQRGPRQQVRHARGHVASGTPLPTWKSDDVVLVLTDAPTPARRRYEETWRQRQVDEEHRLIQELIRQHRAEAPPTVGGQYVYVNDPATPFPMRFILVSHLQ